LRTNTVFLFPRSVKGEAATPQFNTRTAGPALMFPIVPCANTHFPTTMTAEEIADAIVVGY